MNFGPLYKILSIHVPVRVTTRTCARIKMTMSMPLPYVLKSMGIALCAKSMTCFGK